MARGVKQVSQIATAVCDLQDKLPNARVCYLSATGATEVSNLMYAQRLGLYGPGTAFASKVDFVQQVSAGGVAAMELVARDMKQLGLYCSRGLSFDGVEYDRLEHTLSADQVEIYDRLCDAWQVTLQNFDAALELTASHMTKDGGLKVDGKAKGAAYSAFWGSHQRFFNQLLCAMQMPSVLVDIDRELAAGNCCVLQLVNTNEASMERALADLDEDDDLTDLDTTPRDQLLQLVEHCFPVVQHEEYLDKNTNKVCLRVAEDKGGKPILNAEAVAMREQLLMELATIRCPDGPLEMLINYYGPSRVAEVTGRKRRVVRITENRVEKTVIQNRSNIVAMKEANDFQDGKRDILVFSDAGGTGVSYHDDANRPNHRRRTHYLVQAGWVADQAVQGFGRTHRSNQASAPLYKLVCTNLKGHKRFISTVARRLDQLGALTKGQRQAFISDDVADGKMKGFYTAADNLESHWARQALVKFYEELHAGDVEGITIDDFEFQTGLKLRDGEGNLLRELPPITRFLNRLLSLKVEAQGFTFDAFDERLRAVIAQAEAAGTLDLGVETVRADRIERLSQQVVYRHPSGAETSLCEFKLSSKSHPISFDSLMEQKSATRYAKILFMAQNARSGNVYAFVQASDRTLPNGSIEPCYHEIGPDSRRLVPQRDIRDGDMDPRTYAYKPRWNRLEMGDEAQMAVARQLWGKQYAAVPAYSHESLSMLVGLILPIMDRLPSGEGANVKVKRLQTDNGERYIGRVIEPNDIPDVLKRFGITGKSAELTPERIVSMLEAGRHEAQLSNGWRIKRSRQAGAYRLELVGPDYRHMEQMKAWGITAERIDFKQRFWVGQPLPHDGAAAILSRVIADKPCAECVKVERGVAA